ncbi:efflux RND transporter periplasmic adaptor subunit [Cohnella sp. AR92]|uniref:efflux RND transporter periplasmic adaptor subunit n=1 Tax=Cohnella sp. AR92 TaxID=648716 RepID=UPI000F8D6A85|nr:efflux RND transporter periplasmic adaptor subunit [Cohnella sp. AR92]RUS47707.1 efflux RND transporter periplasmic adaptor subunit [Cohnella sp. AR92]
MKKKRIKKIITWVVIVCILGAAGGTGYWYYTKDDAVAAAQTFQQSRVTKGTITQGVSGSGSVAVSETEDALVSEAGTVSTVKVEEGDVVKKGTVLATFEGQDVTLSLNKSKLSLQQQQMTLEQAQAKWKNLQVSGGSEDDIAAAEMSIKSAQLNIEQTKLEIEDYEEKAKAPDPIVAPIDGTVTKVDIKAGDEVQARLAAFTLVNYDKLEVTISADELDVTKLKVGQEANVSIEALSGQEITGKVTEISKDGTSSNGVATFPVIVTLNEIENVLPGMSADVTVVIEQKKEALIVPVDAVESIAGKYFVRVPNNGTSSSSGAKSGNEEAASGGKTDGTAAGEAPAGGAVPSGAPEGFDPNNPPEGFDPSQMQAGDNGGQADLTGKASQAGQTGQTGQTAQTDKAGQTGQTGQTGENTQRGQGWGSGNRTGENRQGGMANFMNQMNSSNEFKMQEITVGITTDSQVEVLSGLTEGQTVLIPVIVNTSSTKTTITGFPGGMGGGFPGGAAGFSGGGNFGGGGFSGGGGTRGGSR